MAPTRKPADTLAAAVTAADEYSAALLTLVNDAITDGRADIDSAAADAALTAAFDAWRTGSSQSIVEAAHGVLAGYTASAQRVIDGRGGVFSDGMRQQWQGNLAAVDRAADDMLSVGAFDGRERLAQAEQDLASARQELAAQTEALEQAVTTGDIDTIMKLRTVVRVEIPGRIGDLASTVLSLQHDLCTEALRNPRRRLDNATVKTDSLVSQIEATYRRIEELNAEMKAATLARSLAEQRVTEATRRLDAASAERDRHAEQHSQQQRAALRQLAGLASV